MPASAPAAVVLSYASPSFAKAAAFAEPTADKTAGRQDAQTINRKEPKEHKEVMSRLDGSLRSLRSLW